MPDILIGSTDYTKTVFIPDPASTTGGGKSGLAAAAMTVSYTRVETDNDVVVTDVTSSLNDLAALTTAHTDWGWKEVSATLAKGLYRLDFADAVFASGAWTAVVHVSITSGLAAASPIEFDLIDPAAVRYGVNTVQLVGGGQSASDLKDFADDGYDPATNKVQGVVLTDTVTTYTGNTPQTGDSYALANGANGFVAIKGDTAAILLDTGTDGVVVAAASKTGYALSSAGVQAIWDALTSALTAVGSIGKLLVDNINATISSRLASGSYTTPPTVGAIADQVWDEALGGHAVPGSTGEALSAAGGAGNPWLVVIDGTRTAAELARGWTAALLGKANGLATTNPKYRDIDDSKDVIDATTDEFGNRSSVTLDLS